MSGQTQGERHAELHKHNVWGVGPAIDRCEPCEKEAAEASCLSMVLIGLTVCAVSFGLRQRSGS